MSRRRGASGRRRVVRARVSGIVCTSGFCPRNVTSEYDDRLVGDGPGIVCHIDMVMHGREVQQPGVGKVVAIVAELVGRIDHRITSKLARRVLRYVQSIIVLPGDLRTV
jgi:hypothetical protein